MAGSVNKVILVGNLGRDPEIRTMQSGGRVCNLALATSENWRDKQTGERREKTEWHHIVVFNDGLVTICERFLRKGSKVYIEGQLETRKWQDQSGQERYTTEIVLRPFRSELTMLDSRADSGGGGGYGGQGGMGSPGAGYEDRGFGGGGTGSSSGGSTPPPSDLDDEIPF